MKKTLILLILLPLVGGCTFWGEERTKTFDAREVSDENTVSFASATVSVNPDLRYKNISGNVNVAIQGRSDGPTKREFHIFTRPGLSNTVLIETHSRNIFKPFGEHQDLMKDMKTIQKGKKRIDGKAWDVYIRSLYDFPEQIIAAAEQQGVSIKKFTCGLEIGARRMLDRQHRIFVSYIKGDDDCEALPMNESLLSDQQMQMIRDFVDEFEANVTISDKSGR